MDNEKTFYIKQGDCLELMKEIPDGSVDLILCDLPYGTTANKWDVIIPYDLLWQQYERIIKDNGAILLTCQMPFTAELAYSNIKLLRYEWIWEKQKPTGHLNAKKMPMKAHENVLVFYKKEPVYNAQGLRKKKFPTIRKGGQGNGTNYGKSDKDALQEYDNYPRDIIQFSADSEMFHPTQKPIDLLEYFIKTYTNEGEVVLDNCMGSGSTGVACMRTGRKFIGFEKEEKYFEIAKARIEEAQSGGVISRILRNAPDGQMSLFEDIQK